MKREHPLKNTLLGSHAEASANIGRRNCSVGILVNTRVTTELPVLPRTRIAAGAAANTDGRNCTAGIQPTPRCDCAVRALANAYSRNCTVGIRVDTRVANAQVVLPRTQPPTYVLCFRAASAPRIQVLCDRAASASANKRALRPLRDCAMRAPANTFAPRLHSRCFRDQLRSATVQ